MILNNPKKFKLKSACISGNFLFVTDKDFCKESWWINSERGGKQIFTREYGKGAIWEKV